MSADNYVGRPNYSFLVFRRALLTGLKEKLLQFNYSRQRSRYRVGRPVGIGDVQHRQTENDQLSCEQIMSECDVTLIKPRPLVTTVTSYQ